jgi:hypothetical protein
MIKTEHEEKMYLWTPYSCLNINIHEKKYVWEFVQTMGWSKNIFHKYFKNIEEKLLENLRNVVNNLVNSKTLPVQWKLQMKSQWRMMAIFRDFHDFMCGRDKKHYIRTDDCRRFMVGIEKGIEKKHFIKPVHRILCGENAPKKFIHSLFKQFN